MTEGTNKFLIVEDNLFQRKMLEKILERLGHQVLMASNGEEAWEILRHAEINFLITDWMMPELNGVDLCRRVRDHSFSHYTYIILVTSRGEKTDLIDGLDAGADDFVVKPFDPSELQVKIRAGERVLHYEKQLIQRNSELGLANNRLSQAYDLIQQGLRLAGQFQKTLLPSESVRLADLHFASFFIPCTFVAGDTFNFFRLDENRVVFYLLDVAGHGISAAMLSFTLSHLIIPPSGGGTESNGRMNHSFLDMDQPTQFAHGLNRFFQSRNDEEHYFTMIYGIVDTEKGLLSFVQAGHPPLVYRPNGGTPQLVGDGGFPLALFANATYEQVDVPIKPGDRLFIYSDGLTECQNAEGENFGSQRLLTTVDRLSHLSLEDAVLAVREEIKIWSDAKTFEDDLSLLAIEYSPNQTEEASPPVNEASQEHF